jgi:hypothetical protein
MAKTATKTRKPRAAKKEAAAEKPAWSYQANERAEHQGNLKKVRRVLYRGNLVPTDPDATVYNEDGSITVTTAPVSKRAKPRQITVEKGTFSKNLRFW